MNTLPQAEHTEVAILGAIMLDGLPAYESSRGLRGEMLSLDSHRRIYRAIEALIEKGESTDYIAVKDELIRRKELDAIGGPAYLAFLTEGIPRMLNLATYTRTVIEKWKLREGIRICDRYSGMFEEGAEADGTLSLLQAEVFDIMQEKMAQRDPRIAAMTVQSLERTLDYTLSAMGLSYGHGKLNDFTMGMQPGEITIVGARSGVGKSSLALQAIYCNAKRGVAGDLFSLEMDELTVQQRLWSMDSGLPFNSIRRKLLNPSEQRALRESAYRVAEMPIRIYADGDMTLSQIAATARLDARRNAMEFFAVDYAQIVNAPGNNDLERVKATSRTLTKLAKSERVHGMILSQLRKMPVEQYNRPPHIGDLAETRQLENDAHVVILVHRGWDETSARISMTGEFLIPKQRNGGTGAMQTTFNKNSLKFD